MPTESSYAYETVYILKPNVSDSDANTIHQKVDNVIAKFGGKLQHRDDWGIKELAYPIDNEKNGRYIVSVYNGKGGVVEEIERHFRILEDVMRYLTVKVDDGYDYTKFRKQQTAQEEEIKRNKEFKDPRKKRDFGGGGRDFGGGGRDFGGGGREGRGE